MIQDVDHCSEEMVVPLASNQSSNKQASMRRCSAPGTFERTGNNSKIVNFGADDAARQHNQSYQQLMMSKDDLF